MPEFKSFHGYLVKDETARNQIAEHEEKHNTDIANLNQSIQNLSDQYTQDKTATDQAIQNLSDQHTQDMIATDQAIQNLSDQHTQDMQAISVQRTQDMQNIENMINESEQAQSGFANYVTPQKYGAVGDGIADDTEAFRQCFANNDFISIPAGEYLITDAITLRSNMRIIGNGIISAPSEEQWVFKGSGIENIHIDGITFKDGTRTKSGYSELYADIFIENSKNIHISNIKSTTGNKVSIILLDACEFFTIKNCKLLDTGYCGIQCYGRCYYGIIDGNEINVGTYTGYANTYAIALSCTARGSGAKKENECKNIIISNNLVYTDLGYWEGIDTHAGDNIFITGNKVIGFYDGITCTRGNNIEAMYPSNIVISNNYVKGNTNYHESRVGAYGISVFGSKAKAYSNIVITNNVFDEVTTPDKNSKSLVVDGLYGFTIQNNIFNYPQFCCIYVNDASRGNIKDNSTVGGGYTFMRFGAIDYNGMILVCDNLAYGIKSFYEFESFENISLLKRLNNYLENGYWLQNTASPSYSDFVPDIVHASPDGSNYKPKGSIALNNNPTSGAPIGWVCNGANWLPYGIIDPVTDSGSATA